MVLQSLSNFAKTVNYFEKNVDIFGKFGYLESKTD